MMADKIKASCPHCKHLYKLAADQSGKKAKCKVCQQIFVVHADIEIEPLPAPNPAPPAKPLRKPPISPHTFFLKLWSGCPAAFRTAFLSTLGVVCALLFAWYTVRLPSLPHLPHKPQAETPEHAGDTALSDRIAALLQLQSDYERLNTLQNVRAQAAAGLNSDGGLLQFFQIVSCLHPQTEELYVKVRQERMPNNSAIQPVYGKLLSAIEAEYNFQQTLLNFPNDKNNWLKHRADIQEAGGLAVNNANEAIALIILFYNEVNPGLLESSSHITEAVQ